MAKKDSTELKKLFGENLRRIRNSKKLSLLDVDYRCDLNESNISKIENGKSDIQLSTIIELAKGLSIHPRELMELGIDFTED